MGRPFATWLPTEFIEFWSEEVKEKFTVTKIRIKS